MREHPLLAPKGIPEIGNPHGTIDDDENSNECQSADHKYFLRDRVLEPPLGQRLCVPLVPQEYNVLRERPDDPTA